jgi:hypothetical protein
MNAKNWFSPGKRTALRRDRYYIQCSWVDEAGKTWRWCHGPEDRTGIEKTYRAMLAQHLQFEFHIEPSL